MNRRSFLIGLFAAGTAIVADQAEALPLDRPLLPEPAADATTEPARFIPRAPQRRPRRARRIVRRSRAHPRIARRHLRRRRVIRRRIHRRRRR
jgi:hypothetical protein